MHENNIINTSQYDEIRLNFIYFIMQKHFSLHSKFTPASKFMIDIPVRSRIFIFLNINNIMN
jgi:hypothetical protein